MKDILDRLEKRREDARLGGGTARIEAQHKRGKLTARERMDRLFDGGQWFEVGIHGTQMAHHDPNDKPAADAVVCGYGKVDGRMVCAASYDFTVKGGSIGQTGEVKVTRLASQRAYEMAGVGPGDIDCAEVHDCFTITEILDIEDLGFFEKGAGGRASLDGATALTGRIPVNTSGGLLAKGHPIGATGVAQITECWWQLRGEAADRQVEINHGNVLQHNVGGRGSGVSVVNILTVNP